MLFQAYLSKTRQKSYKDQTHQEDEQILYAHQPFPACLHVDANVDNSASSSSF